MSCAEVLCFMRINETQKPSSEFLTLPQLPSMNMQKLSFRQIGNFKMLETSTSEEFTQETWVLEIINLA